MASSVHGYAPYKVKKIEISNHMKDVIHTSGRKNSSSCDISFRVVTSRRVIRKAVKSNDSSFSTLCPLHATKGLGLSRKAFRQPLQDSATCTVSRKGSRPIFHITPRNMDNTEAFFLLPPSPPLPPLHSVITAETIKFRARIDDKPGK